MKIVGKKDLSAVRLSAREAIDAAMVPRVTAAMGPKFAIYREKAQGLLLAPTDDADKVFARFVDLMGKVDVVEQRRQAFQARVDNAISALEIEEIIKEVRLDG